MVERPLTLIRPGRLSYRAGLLLQEELQQRVHCGEGEYLILLEHDPVVTRGRRTPDAHLLVDPTDLARQGVELVESSRGGDVTYHGPGQLVGYPILDLQRVGRDLHRYCRDMEGALIRLLGGLGVNAGRVEGKTGIWVENRKIASIGVAVRQWVSMHGFALNIRRQEGFSLIVPCGLKGVRMTSLEEEGAPVPAGFEERLADLVADTYGLNGVVYG